MNEHAAQSTNSPAVEVGGPGVETEQKGGGDVTIVSGRNEQVLARTEQESTGHLKSISISH